MNNFMERGVWEPVPRDQLRGKVLAKDNQGTTLLVRHVVSIDHDSGIPASQFGDADNVAIKSGNKQHSLKAQELSHLILSLLRLGFKRRLLSLFTQDRG
jgi:hypothetical protein